MASDWGPNETRRPTRAKRRVITSCLECYRRKQKCNRVQPCNFCSARGVPERCRYDLNPQQSVRDRVRGLSPLDSLKDDDDSTNFTPPADLLNQIGYSSASRSSELEVVGEDSSKYALNNLKDGHTVAVSDSDAYQSLVIRLPSEQVTSALIDVHFSAENWSFPVLEEHQFRNLYKQVQSQLRNQASQNKDRNLSPTLALFPALLFSVLAVALQFIAPNTEQARTLGPSTIPHCTHLSQRHLDTGQEIIRLFERQKPTTTSIEFYLMKMAWLKNCGRGSESWQCLGTALRQAQEIDLHQLQEPATQEFGASVSDTLLRIWDLEHQKRLWAKIFIMDSHMAVALGRPRGIHREDCSTSTPLDCEYPRQPSHTVPVSTKHSQQPPNTFSPIIFSIALAHKYHDLMSIRASKLDLRDYSRITNLHKDIECLLAELPVTLRPSFPDTTWDLQKPQLPAVRQRLLTTANIFLLALHRPYISTHVASRNAAIEAALTILQAQQNLFTMVPQAQHKLYGYSFYTVDAGVFLTATVLKYPILDLDTNSRILRETQQARTRLGYMKDRSPIASTGEMVLQRCCGIIEANTPSQSSILSSDFFPATPQATDFGTISFFQESGFHFPEQATRELISMLSEPASATNSSANAVPLQRALSYQDDGMPAFDASIGNSPSLSNFTAEDVTHWWFR